MSYIQFDKSQLINLEYSLNKEIIRTNRAGTYSCTTLVGCNTRKYHGLLIAPIPNLDNNHHVLLSSLDETVVQNEQSFNLGIHKYQGDNYIPKGHKYIRDFNIGNTPQITYRVGNVVLNKTSLLVEKEEQILIRYELLEASSPVIMQFKPFLVFRNFHELSKSNMFVHKKVRHIANGVKSKMYDGYPYLNMQFSKEPEFVPVPDWYYNVEYLKEQERGYDYKEDLYTPGYFELSLKKGESVIFSASLKEANPTGLKRKFTAELNKRPPKFSFRECLIGSADQFFVKNEKETQIIGGYPWYGTVRREAFIALPGLTLSTGNRQLFKLVLDSNLKRLKNCILKESVREHDTELLSADIPLWAIWDIQQYYLKGGSHTEIWEKYEKAIKAIFKCYREGVSGLFGLEENGLINIYEYGTALTWMDSTLYSKPVLNRIGFVIEVNALWYNSLMFMSELAERNNDTRFSNLVKGIARKAEKSFIELFWDGRRKYLADSFSNNEKDLTVRANQVIAISMQYSPLSKEMKKAVLDIAHKELLTPRGLRTLSPNSPNYHGRYHGSPEEREIAIHQGAVFPWLFQHFAEAYLSIHNESGISFIKKIVADFEKEMSEGSIGTLSELYEGDPPHKGKGAISYAPSVAAILRVLDLVDKMNGKK